MSIDPQEPVRLITGTSAEIHITHEELQAAGIKTWVVGDDLDASFGTALAGSNELWVHRSNLAAAQAAITGNPKFNRQEHETDAPETHGHPVNDPQ